MGFSFSDSLPIDAVLSDLAAALDAHASAVLVAPPGAGKTTRVPLALLDAPWLKGGKIIVLEPRRLAARAAAERMAATLNEAVGETIGLRVRLQSKVSNRTRVEVVTEGVFARMILDDPSLAGIGAVLFDEFHERSLDADLGLALALDTQGALREDLRLLVMSATLDGARVASLLGAHVPLIESEGRAYPVTTLHAPREPQARIEDEMAKVVLRALHEEAGSILAFLPGQGEITRLAALLQERVRAPNVDIAPLYGAMDRAAQDLAVRPAKDGRRKIVLATSIAETSLTIDGVRMVIDSGLARVPRYEPDIGVTRLETVRVSRASADQRRGRAGRTQPGVCYRLWEEAATLSLEPFAKPEILSADLSGLMLDLAEWGTHDPSQLAFLDPPPAPAVNEARALLQSIGALDAHSRITSEGKAIRALPLPPRLARMVLEAARHGEEPAGQAALVAAVLVERGLGGDAVDVGERLERLQRERSARAGDTKRLAQNWATQAVRLAARGNSSIAEPESLGEMLAIAFPDRIAKARGKPGEFLMANGRAAAVEAHDRLAREPFLAVAEVAGRASAARILAAAPLSVDEVEQIAGARIQEKDEITFDRASASLRARRVRRLDAIVFSEKPLSASDMPGAAEVLAAGIAALGIARLPWTRALAQWRDRVMFLRRAEGDDWPDLSDEALSANGAAWLVPYLNGKTSLAAISSQDLDEALKSLVPWDLARRLDIEAPTHFEAPTGSRIAIDYEAEGGPAMAVRVQELFGLQQHPSLAGGRIGLTLHLLSPAHRPIQITKDLPGFWKGSWAAVKTEMKGRYPRHVWPDDPAAATATTRAKPRGT
ncbi:ATP-dependent helicase HrpB [Methylovirgula sp. 4M-Z18]|uniref:ATP-dependent helicase HrpB n=1 Tax=Methylovirgula sp. 4M-Z18 TaxID=2293567 RepID=UPI000E2FE844|nr:ATP-dependent helicase HrpB [Methylovirgula sp. 4M-Z18]RFB79229.1 ATP-dependent helicase HrpB [Methylovirgula sp. 4M-Z18]